MWLMGEYQKRSLDININKTKYRYVGGEQRNLKLENGHEIKCCAKYKYLGVETTNEGTLDTAMKERNLSREKVIAVLNGML